MILTVPLTVSSPSEIMLYSLSHAGTQVRDRVYSVIDGLMWTRKAGSPMLQVDCRSAVDSYRNVVDTIVWNTVASRTISAKLVSYSRPNLLNCRLGQMSKARVACNIVRQCPKPKRMFTEAQIMDLNLCGPSGHSLVRPSTRRGCQRYWSRDVTR